MLGYPRSDGALYPEVMTASPWTADPDTTLREAAERMLSFKIGCLPVVERSRDRLHMVGLVTESDLLRAALRPRVPGRLGQTRLDVVTGISRRGPGRP